MNPPSRIDPVVIRKGRCSLPQFQTRFPCSRVGAVGEKLNETEQRLINSLLERRDELALLSGPQLASTLGAELTTSLRVTFDNRLAESSLQFFDLRTIPAVRDPIEPRVSDVRFAVDLSGLPPLSFQELTDQDPYFWDFLPAD